MILRIFCAQHLVVNITKIRVRCSARIYFEAWAIDDEETEMVVVSRDFD